MGTKVTITINGKRIITESDKTILTAARESGITIPALCYEPRLEPHRACLVCCVEDKNTARILMSCGTPVMEGMQIETDSPAVLDARKSALELLLSTHYADCRGPCNTTCPATVDIQGYLALAGAGKYQEALKLIRETNPMPLVCGRVCVRYCEANCRRNYVDSPAAINFVKRYVADLEYDRLEHPVVPSRNGKRVAVVGGGPSGLTCAYYLTLKGYHVTIFEAQPKLGGMVRYGIPEYRMPEKILDKEINYIISHGIQVETGVKIGVDMTLDALKQRGYDAIYVAIGAWNGKPMGIEGEDSPHVTSGIRFLEGVKKDGPPVLSGRVAVVGGGNTAIDVARTAVRCGAQRVTILYRRTLEEMPADHEEIKDAGAEGVEFKLLTAPKRVVEDSGKLVGIECYEMYLGDADSSGRRRPLPKKDSEFLFECDHILTAIGQDSELSALKNETWGEIRTKRTTIEVDSETMATNIPGVFAGGDVATGPKAAIDAIGAGRRAATVIDAWLATGTLVRIHNEFLSSKTALAEMDPKSFEHVAREESVQMHKVKPEERVRTFEEVDTGITTQEAGYEAGRCLACGCKTIYDCDLKEYATVVGASQNAFQGRFRRFEPDVRHPYIAIDSNKCILCGRCVRYCGELIGIYALGFISRGAETVVKPALDKPLAETPCISCGNCIEVCPTGAIEYNYPFKRQAPFRTEVKRTICSECGVGCEVDINAVDRDIFSLQAKPYNDYLEGELCRKGRFESSYIARPDRISRCAAGNGAGALALEDASRGVVEKLADITKNHGSDSILFLASPVATMEETYLFASLAQHFGSSLLCSEEDLLRGDIPYLKAFTGLTISSLKQQEIGQADVIVNIGTGLTVYSPVFGFQVKRAVRRGAALIQVGGIDAELGQYVTHHLDCKPGAEDQVIKALLKKIIISGAFDASVSCSVDGYETFKSRIMKSKSSRNAEVINAAADLLTDCGRNVSVIFNAADTKANLGALGDSLNLVLLTCRLTEEGNGLVITQQACNSQGSRDILFDNGFGFAVSDRLKTTREALMGGSVKAIVSLNEDLDLQSLLPDGVPTDIEVVCVFARREGSLSKKAAFVIPYTPHSEGHGSVVSFDGRVKKFRAVFDPLPGFTGYEALSCMVRMATGTSWSIESVRERIAMTLPQYEALRKADVDAFYLVDEARAKGLFGKKMRFAH